MTKSAPLLGPLLPGLGEIEVICAGRLTALARQAIYCPWKRMMRRYRPQHHKQRRHPGMSKKQGWMY
ncbi:unnamed protein product [Symbiodinium sp. CCMP2456]|nr:unnamed protein product [Symbiodinium sp. CCMP2456]